MESQRDPKVHYYRNMRVRKQHVWCFNSSSLGDCVRSRSSTVDVSDESLDDGFEACCILSFIWRTRL